MQAKPDDQQTAAGPDRTGRGQGQDKQHRQVDEHQAHQQHQGQSGQQTTITGHLRVAGRHQHADHQAETDQQRREQARPAGGKALAQALPTHLQHKQQATKQLHGKGAGDKAARLQAQPQPQTGQTGQGPADGRTLHGKQQRRHQVDKGQARTRQQRQAATLPGVAGLKRAAA